MPQPVVHFELRARNAEKLGAFYSGCFGWSVQHMPEMNYALTGTHTDHGIDGGLAEADEHPGVMIYIEVPDLHAALEAVKAAGGEVVMEPADVPGEVAIAQFRDPDGNVVGLVKG